MLDNCYVTFYINLSSFAKILVFQNWMIEIYTRDKKNGI